jgi:ribosomal protein S3
VSGTTAQPWLGTVTTWRFSTPETRAILTPTARQGTFQYRSGGVLNQVNVLGAKGIKICVSGRLGGAEIARQEKAGQGSVPLTTLQADVNYGYAIAFTTYGTIGVKCWIYRGMYNDEKQVFETDVRPGGMMRRGRR